MEIDQLVFSHDKSKETAHIQSVSAQIDIGQITTIIGPNGCGKSTLLGLMSRQYTPQSGRVVLDGKAIAEYKPKELAKRLAVVHQHNDAPADMTVERLVGYGRLPHRSMFAGDREEDEKAIDWALTSTNLHRLRDTPIDQLSGGERQRVWIAMAVAQNTSFLFLDEPTTYLDIYYQFELLELVRSLNRAQSLTIVMVLHDINQAIRYSDTIIVMKDGEIKMKGKPDAIITEETIKSIYGVNAAVRHDAESGLYMVPLGI